MRITKWGEYGILCCLHLARSYGQGAVGASEIGQAQSIPLQYTHQILQRLRKGKVIESLRGPRGGYRLVRKPAEINLRQILDATEGGTLEIVCEKGHAQRRCHTDMATCRLRPVWHDLKAAVDQLLEQKSLASLVEDYGPIIKDGRICEAAAEGCYLSPAPAAPSSN